MKTNRYTVYCWHSDQHELDIDWPRVHQILGKDCVRWLNQQPLTTCQLIVERQQQQMSLVAEFYSVGAYQEFLQRKD
jgi:hypothetical protein